MTPPQTINPYPTIVGFDVVGSLATLRQMGETAYEALRRSPLFKTVETLRIEHGGAYIGKHMGDALLLHFPKIDNGVTFAMALMKWVAEQKAERAQNTPDMPKSEIRMAVHTAQKEMIADAEGDFGYREDVGYHARLLSIANAGQILLSENTVKRGSFEQNTLKPYPRRYLREWKDEPQTVYELLWDGVSKGEPGNVLIPEGFLDLGQYVSRPGKEKEIVDAFQEKNTGGQQYRIVTLHGYGGMGKTRLAVQCALNLAPFFKGKIYRVNLGEIATELLTDEDAIARQMAAAIGTVFGLQGEDLDPRNLPHRLPDIPMLLFLDNYETVKCEASDELMAQIVGERQGVHLLVTGREAIENDDIERIHTVEGLTREEAESLFRQKIAANITKRKMPLTADEEKIIPALLNRVARIPLAIVLLAAQTKTDTVTAIEQGVQDTTLGEMTRLQDGQTRGKNTPHHRSLLLSLTYSFGRLSSESQELFPIIGLFVEPFSLEAITAILNSPHTRAFLNELVGACLLEHTVDTNTESYYALLNPTRDFARLKFAEQEQQDAVQTAPCRERFGAYYNQFVQECSQGIDAHDLKVLQRVRNSWRNVVAACEIASSILEPTIKAYLLNQMGFFLDAQGRYAEVEPLYLEALGIDRTALPEGHPNIALRLNNLAELYRAQGRYGEAEPLFKEALAIVRPALPEEHPDIARSLNNLAALYYTQGRYDEAEPLYEEALTIYRHTLPEGHPNIATSLNNLSLLYKTQGCATKAEPLYEEALAIRRTSLPEGHPDIAQSLNNLAAFYYAQGRYGEAETLYEESVKIIQQALGDEHPHTKLVMKNLARLLEEKAERNQGQDAGAPIE